MHRIVGRMPDAERHARAAALRLIESPAQGLLDERHQQVLDHQVRIASTCGVEGAGTRMDTVDSWCMAPPSKPTKLMVAAPDWLANRTARTRSAEKPLPPWTEQAMATSPGRTNPRIRLANTSARSASFAQAV